MKNIQFDNLISGSNYFTYFLNTFVNQEWKDKYIHSFTSLSGAFGGSTDSLAYWENKSCDFIWSIYRALFLPYPGVPFGVQMSQLLKSYGKKKKKKFF